MDITEEVIKHLSTNIKTTLEVSPINGIGVFALRNINIGENLFPHWEYDSGIYLIPNDRLNEIPKQVLQLLDRYFINEECGYKVIRLFKGMNLICNTISFCNSAYPNKEMVNIDANGVAKKDILCGEEILEWYTENINLDMYM